ncbi:hypothetical protein [Nakamurella sp.]|uniref:hypothetical protein n=1 Tax=Nakamurella sp. TaxID=1869182 RepID=UPI0037852649
MTTIRKTMVTALTALALTGLGAGVAAAAQVGDGIPDITFFNASPYTMDVTGVDQPIMPANIIAEIAPGQSVTVPGYTLQARAGTGINVSEGDRQTHVTDISAIQITGYQPGVATGCTPFRGRTNAKEMGCMVQTPNVIAGESGPMQISIWTANPKRNGAATDLDATAAGSDPAAMGNFLSGLATINPSSVSFDTNVDSVGWGTGKQMMAGAPVWNCGSEDANEQIGGGATHEESTSVTGTLTLTQGIKLFDTVDTDISVSISAGHTWTSSTTDTYTVGENIAPHNVGWLGSIPSTETVTGAVTATPAGADPVVISHISFTEPGQSQPGKPAYQYVTHTRAMTQDEISTYCTPSAVAGSTRHLDTVTGGTVGDVSGGTATSIN